MDGKGVLGLTFSVEGRCLFDGRMDKRSDVTARHAKKNCNFVVMTCSRLRRNCF
jgi:hypothetical protein